MLTETYPKPFDVARVLIRGLYHCTLSSINRATIQNGSKQLFFSLFFFSSSKSHRIDSRARKFLSNDSRWFQNSILSLSLSLSHKFTRRFEDHQQTGRDRRIRGYFRWFGSIRSAVSHSKHETQWNFSSFSLFPPPPPSSSFHLRSSYIACPRAGDVGMFRFWNLRVIPTTEIHPRETLSNTTSASGQVSYYGARRWFDNADLTTLVP